MVLPLDMPDDYLWLPGSGKAQLGDLGELAVRLGSPVTYDRRGTVYWFDDFEGGKGKWKSSVLGTGAAWNLTDVAVNSGGLCGQLVARSDLGLTATISRQIAPALLSNYGLEMTTSLLGSEDEINFWFIHSAGAIIYTAGMQLDPGTGTLNYYDEDGNWISVGDVDYEFESLYGFAPLKFVIDLINNNYVRVLFRHFEFDLADIPIKQSAGIGVNYIEIGLSLKSISGENGTINIDNVIVTVGDP